MPKLKNIVPSYRLHKQSGQAIVTLNGRDHLLGPHGTKTSRAKYDMLIREWLANGRQPLTAVGCDLTVCELVARYWSHVEHYYVKNGLPTSEQHCIKSAIRVLLRLYENEPTAMFGPLALVAVRDAMIECGWTRGTVNHQVDRIRRMFRWGVEQQLVPVSTYHALLTVAGLRKGRCSVRESQPVKPVSDEMVERTLPYLPEVVADMVRLQRLMGCRPNEVCVVRPCDIDRSSDVWLYVPESHKTEHLDRQRLIFIGPQAQAILLRYLARDPESYCFQPRDSEAKRRAEQHANRQTPPNHGNRPGKDRKRRPRRPPTDHYTTSSYSQAIERACDKVAMQAAAGQPSAALPGETVTRWYRRLSGTSKDILLRHVRQHRWTANRLRHSAATEIRRKFGIEAAQIVLGHATVDVTQIYAERDVQLGLEVARKIG
jgi:integrase